MNTSGEKFVKWVTVKDATVELINMYPGTVGPAGIPWYHVSVTMDTNRFVEVPQESHIMKAIDGVYGVTANSVLIRDDIVRVSWDYNHLWDTEASHKLWKVHAGYFMDKLELVLKEYGNAYMRKCQRCGQIFDSDGIADLSRIPGPHFWATLCHTCEEIVRTDISL